VTGQNICTLSTSQECTTITGIRLQNWYS